MASTTEPMLPKPGDDDHLEFKLPLLDRFEKLYPREPRHLDVGDQEIEMVVLDLLEGIGAVLRSFDEVAFVLKGVHQVL